jgi:hypothetical protein
MTETRAITTQSRHAPARADAERTGDEVGYRMTGLGLLAIAETLRWRPLVRFARRRVGIVPVRDVHATHPTRHLSARHGARTGRGSRRRRLHPHFPAMHQGTGRRSAARRS